MKQKRVCNTCGSKHVNYLGSEKVYCHNCKCERPAKTIFIEAYLRASYNYMCSTSQVAQTFYELNR